MLKTNSKLLNTPNNSPKLKVRRIFSFLACIAICLPLVLLSSCGNDEGPSTEDGYNREAMLQVYSNWLQTEYASLETEITAMDEALSSFEAAPDESKLALLQGTFKSAYLQWQHVDFMTAESAMSTYLVESANTFPVKTDLVENNIASGNTNLEAANQFSAQGFPALDYLLYAKELDYLSEANTMAYLRLLVDRLATKTKSTVDGWQINESDFIKDSGSDAGGSISTLFNAYVQSFETRTRDAKVGIPAGVRTDNQIQLEQVEARYSKESLNLLVANVKAMQDFFNGSEQDGFDDYLDFLDSKKDDLKLSDAINQQFESIIANAQSIEGPLDTSIESDKMKAIALFNEMQKLVILLKVDMASELGIFINYADNDGDS